MASFRLFEYKKEDLSNDNINSLIEKLKKYSGDLGEREWNIKQIQQDTEKKILTFVISYREEKEFSTIEGMKKLEFLEEYDILVFYDKQKVAIGKAFSILLAKELNQCVNYALFNNKLKNLPKMLQSNDQLLSKLEEDKTIIVNGLNARRALGMDKISGSDRTDIRDRKIYEGMSSGIITEKTFTKKFNNPIGDARFCIKTNGLITIFKKNMTHGDVASIIEFLLDYLKNTTPFTKTLHSY
ncbi:MAG: hypothetical protein KJ771_08545 [Nanoarchaeota archaeon]|nr:hypothetical protein [Nanoarchaeota archaeon]